MTIQIEKDIPIPSKYKYPLDFMQVGDSFYEQSLPKSKIAPYISIYKKTHPEENFTVRKMPNGGVRVWRIK